MRMRVELTRYRFFPTVPNLLKQCHAVFKAALYSSLAVPEILERGTAMASTFEDVEKKGEAKSTGNSQATRD